MAIQFQNRRGTVSENNSFTGAAGEITVDTTNNRVRVHDGDTLGGFPIGDYCNILDYGAKCDYDFLTDTGTDDTDAFQAALDAGEKTIFIPSSTKITSITVDNYGVKIFGVGKGRKTIIKCVGTTDTAIIVNNYDFHLQNLAVEGLSDTVEKGEDYTQTGIQLYEPSGNLDSYIDNCHFRYLKTCICPKGRNLFVTDTTFSNSGLGVFVNESYTETSPLNRSLFLENCRFHYMSKDAVSDRACIYINPSLNFFDVSIKNCFADGCRRFFAGYAGMFTIADTESYDARDSFADIDSSPSLEVSKKFINLSNIMYSQDDGYSANGLNVDGSSFTHGNISNFTSLRSGGHGIYLDRTYVSVENCEIYNAGQYADNTYSGLYLDTGADSVHLKSITVMQDRGEVPTNKAKYAFEIYGTATRAESLRVDNFPSNSMYLDSGVRFDGKEPFNQEKHIKYDTAAPTAGTWSKGDIVFNSSPDATEYIGWTAVAGGTPGTWKGFGVIAS